MTIPTEVYQPFRPDVENQIQTAKRFNNIENRLDNFKLRLDVLDEALKAILKGEDVSDGELLKWFKAHKEQLAKQYREIVK